MGMAMYNTEHHLSPHPSLEAAAVAAAAVTASASSTSSPLHACFPACQTLHVAKAMVEFPKHVRPAWRREGCGK